MSQFTDASSPVALAESAPGRDDQRLATQYGAALVVALSRVMKACALYDRHNTIANALAMAGVAAIRDAASASGQVVLLMNTDNCYVNGRRIAFVVSSYALFRALLDEMLQRGIGSLTFHADVTAPDVLTFMTLFLACAGKDGNHLLLRRQLSEHGIAAIDVGPIEAVVSDTVADDEASSCQSEITELYTRTFSMVREVMNEAVSRKIVNVRKAKRTMQHIIDVVMQDEGALLGLASLHAYDEYTYTHSINVTFYAVALGQRLGFPKTMLSHLGLAALFHDLGKLFVPRDILNKPAKLSEDEWAIVRNHPMAGAERLIRMKEWSELTARMIAVAFEHHLHYDMTGYPRLAQKKDLSLFSKIVTLADCYDALGRARAYRNVVYGPEKILGIMLEQSGKTFDPALVKIFINMIGIFPLGSLVELNTGERGVVIGIPEQSEHVDRPRVALFDIQDGVCIRGNTIDLRETDPATGAFTRDIVRSLNPNEYHFNLLDFFLA